MVVSVLLGVDSISPSGILGWNTTRMKEKQLSMVSRKGMFSSGHVSSSRKISKIFYSNIY